MNAILRIIFDLNIRKFLQSPNFYYSTEDLLNNSCYYYRIVIKKTKWPGIHLMYLLNGEWKGRGLDLNRQLSHAYHTVRCMIGWYLYEQTPGTNSRNVLLNRRSATSNNDPKPRGSAASSGLVISYLATIIIGQPWISFCKLSFLPKVAATIELNVQN